MTVAQTCLPCFQPDFTGLFWGAAPPDSKAWGVQHDAGCPHVHGDVTGEHIRQAVSPAPPPRLGLRKSGWGAVHTLPVEGILQSAGRIESQPVDVIWDLATRCPAQGCFMLLAFYHVVGGEPGGPGSLVLSGLISLGVLQLARSKGRSIQLELKNRKEGTEVSPALSGFPPLGSGGQVCTVCVHMPACSSTCWHAFLFCS